MGHDKQTRALLKKREWLDKRRELDGIREQRAQMPFRWSEWREYLWAVVRIAGGIIIAGALYRFLYLLFS